MIKLFQKTFDAYVRGVKRSRLRRMMRGYRNLRKMGRLSSIPVIKRELTFNKLNIEQRFFSARFFGAGLISSELIVRQYLLLRIGDLKLNRALLLSAGKSGGKVLFPMPEQWIDLIEKNGFKVNRFACSLLWAGYIFLAYIYGFIKICNILINAGRPRCRKCTLKPYAYFNALSPNNIPDASSDSQCYDIVSWYEQWRGRKLGIDAIHHSVRNTVCERVGDLDLVEQPDPLPPLKGLSELASYLGWALTALFFAAFDLLRARWWHALLLNQAALVSQARIVPLDYLAREYLFHHTGYIYRPLWSYEVERRGSTISLYFYSTNNEVPKLNGRLSHYEFGFGIMSWPRYLVWDKGQENFVQQLVEVDAQIEIVGPIWFSDKSAQVPVLPQKTVAVFDVTTMRESTFQVFMDTREFYLYNHNITKQFLFDIRDSLTNFNCYMAHKRKRNIGKRAHPLYRSAMKSLEHSTNYISVNPDLSAMALVQKCDAVISIPFTSTALIGREANKPSVYYDSSGLLQKDDPAAHGIPIIQGIDELRAWIATTLLDKQ